MARSWLGSCAIFKAKNNIQKMAYRIISWPYVSRKYMLHHLRRNNNNNDNKNQEWYTHCSTKNSENFQKIWKKIYATEWAFCKFPSFFDFPSNFGKSTPHCGCFPWKYSKNFKTAHSKNTHKRILIIQYSTISFTWENSKMFNITLKYFSIFNNKPPASWIADITTDFLACYFYSYYSSFLLICIVR